jgi:hypothetical protein
VSDLAEKQGDQGHDADQAKRQRVRSIAIALALGFLVLLFYAATLVRLGGAIDEKRVDVLQGVTKAS